MTARGQHSVKEIYGNDKTQGKATGNEVKTAWIYCGSVAIRETKRILHSECRTRRRRTRSARDAPVAVRVEANCELQSRLRLLHLGELPLLHWAWTWWWWTGLAIPRARLVRQSFRSIADLRDHGNGV